jgi:hypothetical protein
MLKREINKIIAEHEAGEGCSVNYVFQQDCDCPRGCKCDPVARNRVRVLTECAETYTRDYCGRASDAWPIMVKYKIQPDYTKKDAMKDAMERVAIALKETGEVKQASSTADTANPLWLPQHKGISAPAAGWKRNTYYVVIVAHSAGNPMHYAILATGLEPSTSEKRTFGNYSALFNSSYDGVQDPNEVYYLTPVKEIFTEA